MPSLSSSKKTVLFINLYTEIGGGEVAIYELLRGMDRTRFHPIMMFNRRGPFVEKIEAIGVDTVLLPYRTVMLKSLVSPRVFIDTLRASRSLYQYLKQQAVHVIHCADVYTLVLIAIPVIRLRIPVIYNMIFFYEWLRMIAFNVVAAFTVNTIITNSEAVRRDLQQRSLFLRKKSVTAYPAVDAEKFRPLREGEFSVLRKELNVPPRVKLIGMIGRFDPEKGQDVFLEAASILLKKRKDVQFVVVGGLLNADVISTLQPYYDYVRSQYAQLHLQNEVHFLDQRDDVSAVIKGLDLVVVPSRREGFGLVLLESLASGVPLVTTETVGALGLVKDYEGVFVARNSDPALISEKIEEALMWKERAGDGMPDRLHESVTSYTWKNYARNVEKVYDSLIQTA